MIRGIAWTYWHLLQYSFFGRVVVQADHYVNILLRSDPKVTVFFFAAPILGLGGVSGRLIDTAFRSLRAALAWRTSSPPEYLPFRVLLFLEPAVKPWVRLR